MANGTITNVVIGSGTLQIKNPYTEASWASIGYTRSGAQVAHTPVYQTGKVPSFTTFPVDSICLETPIFIALTILESTISNLKAVYPAYNTSSSTSSKIVMGVSDGTHIMVGFRIVASGPLAAVRTLTMPYCRAGGAANLSFAKTEGQFPNLVLQCFSDGTNEPYTLEDA